MKFRLPVKIVSFLKVILLGCAVFSVARVQVKAQIPVVPIQASCPPFCDWNSNGQPASTPRATFRVTLNGFRVNRESDDDIFEGDGKGDEVFIASHLWLINRDGTARSIGGVQTKVMGDTNNYPERVFAGSGRPGKTLGGLRTGDAYPSLEPWRRTVVPLPDRPPIILWQGALTQGRDAVVILPVIWEWDSYDQSESQRSVAQNLNIWFEHQRPAVARFIVSPPASPVQQSLYVDRDPYSGLSLYRYQLVPPGGVSQYANSGLGRVDELPLGGKAGTRPIGYNEAGSDIYGNSIHVNSESLAPVELVLTYDSAVSASQTVNFSVKGVFEIRYTDAHDHGDYSLYLQVERVPDRYKIETTPRIRPL